MLNDGNSFQGGGHNAYVGIIISPHVRHASVDLGKDFPNSCLAGKSHNVILVDNCDHAELMDEGKAAPARGKRLPLPNERLGRPFRLRPTVLAQ